jgi:hypothetical protein
MIGQLQRILGITIFSVDNNIPGGLPFYLIKIVTCIRVVKITYFRQIVPCIVAIWDFQKPNLSISPLSPSNQMVD